MRRNRLSKNQLSCWTPRRENKLDELVPTKQPFDVYRRQPSRSLQRTTQATIFFDRFRTTANDRNTPNLGDHRNRQVALEFFSEESGTTSRPCNGTRAGQSCSRQSGICSMGQTTRLLGSVVAAAAEKNSISQWTMQRETRHHTGPQRDFTAKIKHKIHS